MPSESETLGFVVLEAMASSVPVVAVRAGGVTGIVQHNVTGLLSDATSGSNAASLSDNVFSLINDPIRRYNLGINARKYAEKLSWYTATEKLRNIQYPYAMRLKKTLNDRNCLNSRNLTAQSEILQQMRVEESMYDLTNI